MRASIHDVGDTDVVILSEAKARASILTNGKDIEVSCFFLFNFKYIALFPVFVSFFPQSFLI